MNWCPSCAGRRRTLNSERDLGRTSTSNSRDRRTSGKIRCPHAGRAARRRADHPSDRASRSENHNQAAKESDRRDDRALPSTRGKERARPGDNPDQTDRGRSGGLSARCRIESPLFAQRNRHNRAGRNSARLARGRISIFWSASISARRSRSSRSSLVCILDADKEGFLRSQTSLIQTAGRAARHVNGEVVLFADQVTQSMQGLISISEYRRGETDGIQREARHHPQTVRRAVQESLHTILRGREIAASVIQEAGGDFNVTELLRELEDEMQKPRQISNSSARRFCATRSWK